MDSRYLLKNCTVIFTGGQAPEPSVAEPFFERLESVSLVIAADSGLDTLKDYMAFFRDSRFDFSPDILLGDMDSISDKSLLDDFCDVQKKFYPCDKDFTDTELALMKAHELDKDKSSFLVLVGGNGGRADHFMGIMDTFSFDYRADCWLCGEQAVFFLEEGKKLIAKGLKRSGYISVARPSSFFEGGRLVTKGLEWNVDAALKKGMPSLSNRLHDEKGTASFYAEQKDFLIFLPIDASFSFG